MFSFFVLTQDIANNYYHVQVVDCSFLFRTFIFDVSTFWGYIQTHCTFQFVKKKNGGIVFVLFTREWSSK
jgi:hypothetical protein